MESVKMVNVMLNGRGNEIPNRSVSFEQDSVSGIHQTLEDRFSDLISKTEELEQRIEELSEFNSNKKRKRSYIDNVSYTKEVCSRRMQELIRRFGTILNQIVERPVDLGTIRKKMESNKYKSVKEIYADSRLVLLNAVKHNDKESDVHLMSKTLLAWLDDKWMQLLPKVVDAERRQKEMVSRATVNRHLCKEPDMEKCAREMENEVDELSVRVDELREAALNSCRKFSTRDKRELSAAVAALAPDYFRSILEIIHPGNTHNLDGEEMEIDINVQSDLTLWKLNSFVKKTLEMEVKNLKAMTG